MTKITIPRKDYRIHRCFHWIIDDRGVLNLRVLIVSLLFWRIKTRIVITCDRNNQIPAKVLAVYYIFRIQRLILNNANIKVEYQELFKLALLRSIGL